MLMHYKILLRWPVQWRTSCTRLRHDPHHHRNIGTGSFLSGDGFDLSNLRRAIPLDLHVRAEALRSIHHLDAGLDHCLRMAGERSKRSVPWRYPDPGAHDTQLRQLCTATLAWYTTDVGDPAIHVCRQCMGHPYPAHY